MLKDPEVIRELQNSNTDDKLTALLDDIELNDEDTIETVSKKHSKRLKEVVDYFTEKLKEVETNAVEKATAPTRQKEEQEIKDFSDKNPGMNNPEVVALMQPLYDKGKSLSEAYAVATKALDLDPTTGEPVGEEKKEEKGKEAKGEEKKETKPISSMKSNLSDDSGEEEDEKKDEGPLSIDQVIAASSNEFIAKHGDPFE